MPRTPWTKNASVPSDRIRPKNTHQQQKSRSPSVQGGTEPAKSNAVGLLENLISNLQSLNSLHPHRDLKRACFCLAREHPVSPYTPICTSCGLVVCQINKPHHACPHCASALLSAHQRTSLLDRLQGELSQTLVNEQAERDRQIEEARKAAGAFPSLPSNAGFLSTSIQAPAPRPAAADTHKVLSLNSKTKRVVVSSYTSTPAHSRPVSRTSQSEATTNPEEDPHLVRVPPPLPDVDHASGRVDPSRPWQNLAYDSVKYIPLPKSKHVDLRPE